MRVKHKEDTPTEHFLNLPGPRPSHSLLNDGLGGGFLPPVPSSLQVPPGICYPAPARPPPLPSFPGPRRRAPPDTAAPATEAKPEMSAQAEPRTKLLQACGTGKSPRAAKLRGLWS